MIRIKLFTMLGELRWSRADLARAAKIRPNTINEIYNCLCERINLEHLALICETLDGYIPNIIIGKYHLDILNRHKVVATETR